MESATGKISHGAWHRSKRTSDRSKPWTVRCSHLRGRRAIPPRSSQLSLRPASTRIARSREGGRCEGFVVCHFGGRGCLARKPRLRRNIAQGAEAGGHRGVFLTEDISTQVGTIALVPQIADAVKVPVIAAGGIADARGIVAAFALGASAVQLGTAYLLCPEARISAAHRIALRNAKDNETVLTNVFTGRPTRGIVNRFVREVGPICDDAPTFPLAVGAVAPLRSKSDGCNGLGRFHSALVGSSCATGAGTSSR
jgi:Nitronate monooxygenase